MGKGKKKRKKTDEEVHREYKRKIEAAKLRQTLMRAETVNKKYREIAARADKEHKKTRALLDSIAKEKAAEKKVKSKKSTPKFRKDSLPKRKAARKPAPKKSTPKKKFYTAKRVIRKKSSGKSRRL